jgi:hypothetical protein
MKRQFFVAIAIALSLTIAPAARANPIIVSPGVITFHSSGVMNGSSYSTVTMNWNNNTMRFNYDDGGSFTAVVEQNMFWVMMGVLSNEDRSPTTVNMD